MSIAFVVSHARHNFSLKGANVFLQLFFIFSYLASEQKIQPSHSNQMLAMNKSQHATIVKTSTAKQNLYDCYFWESCMR